MRVNESCTVCGNKLSGKQKMYCSSQCKNSYTVRKEYLANNKQYQKKYREKCSKTEPFRYRQYQDSAKSRGLEFALTFDEFCSFWKKDCTYCGSEIETIGLDRIDSSIGYNIDNVVPCCWSCNRMKLNMDSEEFIEHIIKIFDHIIR